MIREFQGEYRWLSNFAPVKIVLDGIIYATVEHAYMSAKSDNPKWKAFCSDPMNSAADVKRKSRTIALKSGWDELKLTVMENCLNQKFSKEPYRSKLLKTGSVHIQEGNLWNDKFWGICLKTNIGKNHLGKLIMKIREKLNSDDGLEIKTN